MKIIKYLLILITIFLFSVSGYVFKLQHDDRKHLADAAMQELIANHKMKTKDFSAKTYSLAVNSLWEFFDNHPEYILIKHEHIKNGTRAYYTIKDEAP